MSRAALTVLLVALAAAAHAPGAFAASAPAYRAGADAACARANARLAKLPEPRTSDEVRRWVVRAVPIMSASVRRVRALAPPRALRARHRAWSRVLARRAATARSLRARIARGAPPVATLRAAAPRLTRLKRASRARARALGLRTCAGRRAS